MISDIQFENSLWKISRE